MKKTTKFKKLVRENRQKLRDAGYPPSTISSWEHGHRVPSYEAAVELSKIFEMEVGQIPYYQTVVND